MQLKFISVKDFTRSWQNDFLGQKGLLLPASSRIKLGEKVSLNIAVAGETWGRIEATAVWANRDVRKDPDLPAGIFLRSMSSDKDFDRRINALG